MADDKDSKPAIAVMGPNLSLGGTLAGVTITQALKNTYPVRLVGCQFGHSLWPGLADADIDVDVYPGAHMPSFLAIANRIARDTSADIIIAHQLRLSSFGIALLHRMRKKSRCIVYIDDDDIALTMPGRSLALRTRLGSVTGDLATRLMVSMRKRADAVICGSDYFSRKFGGTTVALGRDASQFDPQRHDPAQIRAALDIDANELVIGFIGNPRPHTGIEDLVKALEQSGNNRYTLLVAPTGKLTNFASSLFAQSPARIRLLKDQPSRKVPDLLAASDCVVLPQRSDSVTLGQLPARLVDAMAMARPIVSTRISDFSNVLEGCGLLINERRPDEIAEALKWLDENRAEAQAMGNRARLQFLATLSLDSMRDKLVAQIEALRR